MRETFQEVDVLLAPATPLATAAPMPIGMQIIAAPWREDLCLRVAAELEQRGLACAK